MIIYSTFVCKSNTLLKFTKAFIIDVKLFFCRLRGIKIFQLKGGKLDKESKARSSPLGYVNLLVPKVFTTTHNTYYYTLRSQSLFRELQIILYILSCGQRGLTAAGVICYAISASHSLHSENDRQWLVSRTCSIYRAGN